MGATFDSNRDSRHLFLLPGMHEILTQYNFLTGPPRPRLIPRAAEKTTPPHWSLNPRRSHRVVKSTPSQLLVVSSIVHVAARRVALHLCMPTSPPPPRHCSIPLDTSSLLLPPSLSMSTYSNNTTASFYSQNFLSHRPCFFVVQTDGDAAVDSNAFL